MTVSHHETSTERRASFFSPYTDHRPWGRIDLPDPAMIARSGISRYRLVVFPPGTSEPERHDLVVARRWWIGAAIATIVAESMVRSLALGAGTAILIAAIALAVSWYWLARTRNIRRNARTLRVAVVMVGGPREVLGDIDLFNECCARLGQLESSEERPDPVEYEVEWAQVYDRMAGGR